MWQGGGGRRFLRVVYESSSPRRTDILHLQSCTSSRLHRVTHIPIAALPGLSIASLPSTLATFRRSVVLINEERLQTQRSITEDTPEKLLEVVGDRCG